MPRPEVDKMASIEEAYGVECCYEAYHCEVRRGLNGFDTFNHRRFVAAETVIDYVTARVEHESACRKELKCAVAPWIGLYTLIVFPVEDYNVEDITKQLTVTAQVTKLCKWEQASIE